MEQMFVLEIIKCSSNSGSCTSRYTIQILSLSSNTNAHLGSFGTYPTKICCCAPGDWEWINNYRCVGDIRQRQQQKSVCPYMNFNDAKKDMAKWGVFVEFGGKKGLIEESPFSYKDIDEVVRIRMKQVLERRLRS